VIPTTNPGVVAGGSKNRLAEMMETVIVWTTTMTQTMLMK
jgi:hypothetical protein